MIIDYNRYNKIKYKLQIVYLFMQSELRMTNHMDTALGMGIPIWIKLLLRVNFFFI